MPDYIKRLQSRLKSKGVTLSRDVIVASLETDINDENIEDCFEQLLNSYQSSTGIQTVSNHLEVLDTSIELSNPQKETLVMQTSQQLGITLVGSEVKEIAQTISSQFSDRRQMLSSITNAITAYTAHITTQEQEIVSEGFASVQGQLNRSNSNIKATFNNLQSEIARSNLDFKSIEADLCGLFAIS